MLAPLQTKESMKLSFLATIWKYGKFAHDSASPQSISHSEKMKVCNYALFSVFSNILQNVLSKSIAYSVKHFAITAVTKSSNP